MADAAVQPAEVGYVNAHGTSTSANDVLEADVLRRVLGTGALVSSTKGVTGHSLAASGAIETAFTAPALRDAIAPPTAGVQEVDPRVEVDLVHSVARGMRTQVAVKVSAGFGGHNAAVVPGAA